MELKFIGAEMSTQDNRGGQYPMYAIQEDVRVWVEDRSDYDERERTEDWDTGELCDACLELVDEDREDGIQPLPDDCGDCPWGAFTHYRVEERLAVEMTGVFFTEAACQRHIDTATHRHIDTSTHRHIDTSTRTATTTTTLASTALGRGETQTWSRCSST